MPARDAATPVQLSSTPAYRANLADLGPLADDFAGALGVEVDYSPAGIHGHLTRV